MDQYEIKLDRRVLKQLGSQLYGDTPSVIAELVANSYDADAHNVWITIETDSQIVLVEDDGIGMSAASINDSFLNIGYDKRTGDGTTKSGRKIMGRKGIGKLAVFSLTNNLNVLSIVNGKKAGCSLDFIRITESNEQPTAIDQSEITFDEEKISATKSGTRLELIGVKKRIALSYRFIVKKLIRTFDVNDSNFTIYIRKNKEEYQKLVRSSLNYFSIMDTIVTIGESFKDKIDEVKSNNICSKYKTTITYNEIVNSQQPKTKNKLFNFPYTITVEDETGNDTTVDFSISGWIGTVGTLPDLRNLADGNTDGSDNDTITINDNRISLYSRGKLGEYDILQKIKNNRNSEAYVIGELYVDIFEQDGLSDMAISNRRGYEENDPRYVEVIKIVKRLLGYVVNQKDQVSKLKKADEQEAESQKIKNEFNNAQNKSVHVFKQMNDDDRKDVEDDFKQFSRVVSIDYRNKKPTHLLISHRQNEVSAYGDFLIELLLSINSNLKNIITFTSNPLYGIHKGKNIFDELKKCFRPDYYVVFLFTKSFYDSNACLAEAGAAWATNTDYMNFPIDIEYSDIDRPLDNAKAGSQFLFDSEAQIHDFCLAVQGILDAIDSHYDIELIKKNAIAILDTHKYKFEVPTYYPKRRFQANPLCSKCNKMMKAKINTDKTISFVCECGNILDSEIH